MRIRVGALAVAVVLAAGCSGRDENGGCARSGLYTLSPASAAVGQSVHVTGANFLAECGDTTDVVNAAGITLLVE